MIGWFLQFLKFIQARIRELKVDQSSYMATVLLIGIPNVGKSAIANSLHQIGRISAAGIDYKLCAYQNKRPYYILDFEPFSRQIFYSSFYIIGNGIIPYEMHVYF